MITMTEQAGAYLDALLKRAEASDEKCARLARGEGAFQLKLGRPESHDETHVHGGKVVLAIEQGLASDLAGRTLDVREAPDNQHKRLTLVRKT